MKDAYSMLVEIADYTPVDDTVDNYSSKISTNNFSKKNKQDYTLTTWLDFTDNYAVAKSWADKDEDYRQDTEKYEIDYNKYEYGPYIAYDVDGNVVTSDSQTPYYYVFVGEFYETDTSTEPSQFETGDYAMIDGTLVQLNGHRYYGYSISDTYSARQQEIYDAQTNTDTANTNLAPVDSDEAYQNYTTAQSKFASADPEAFTTATVDTLNSYGSSTSADTYTGADQDAVYVSYKGKIYKNTTTGETDDYTKNVLYAINGELDGVKTRNTHKVTFNYVVNGTPVNQFTDEVHYYGDVVPLNYDGDGKVISWSVVRDGITNPYCISNTSSSYDLKVQTDSTVNVYVTTDDSAKLEVQIKDYFGRAQVVYVDSGTVVTANGDTLEFSDGQSKTNQACNYIKFNGFKIGNKALTSATITENTVITASGNKQKDTMTYTVDGGVFANATPDAVTGKLPSDNQYKVDDLIVISANSDDCKGIALETGKDENGNPTYVMLTYDTTYSFYAFPVIKAFNGTVEFKVMTADDLEKYDIDGVAPQSFGAGVYANGKLSMYCTMTTGLSSSVNIIERGVIASASANTEDTLVKGATGVKTFRSSTDVNSTQYLYSIKTSTNIYARSYVSYELKENINGVDVSIPLVSYGDIVSSADC
jgi:hypothetical protein